MLGYGSDKRDDIVDLDFIKKYIAHAQDDSATSDHRSGEVYGQATLEETTREQGLRLLPKPPTSGFTPSTFVGSSDDLSETVEVKHVMFAETILEATLSEQDPGVMVGAQPKENREFRSLVARKVIEYLKEKNQYENIDPEFIHHWMTENDFSIDKAVLTSMLESFSKNKETKLRKNSNGTYEYDGSQNPAYSMW